MSNPDDTLRRGALRYHMQESRGSSCGSMAIDMDLILSGLVTIGPDSRLYVTDAGLALLAQVDRNPEGHDPAEGHGAEHESPVGSEASDAPKGISHAQ